jgi:hypothetical protein
MKRLSTLRNPCARVGRNLFRKVQLQQCVATRSPDFVLRALVCYLFYDHPTTRPWAAHPQFVPARLHYKEGLSANRSQCPQQGQGPGLLTMEIAMINGLVLCLTRVLTRLLSQAQPIRTHNQGPILLVPNSALSRVEASLKRPSTNHHQQCIKSSSTVRSAMEETCSCDLLRETTPRQSSLASALAHLA